jgi:hypothetical protein
LGYVPPAHDAVVLSARHFRAVIMTGVVTGVGAAVKCELS